ncbi:oxidoreductase [Nocardioides cynanchi]|uniref:oxidoreductase n=1 Tax=Nocardioides cynanchi TaxID=2558918 RepID=UPI0012440A10|nr:oxidoreductase [Nocardioides cynanchi]
MSWSPADIPDLSGRTALVTGVSRGGLGYFTALELARAGARVVLAGRSPDKLTETERAIRDDLPDAPLERLVVDLADLTSVGTAAGVAAGFGPIDLLVNNAGIMATPYRRTVDGFESQLATNHFGPFLLTGLLLPQLADDARVVTVSSQMHRVAHRPPLGDPRAKPRPYLRWIAYSQTKLANLLFTFELDRRLRASGSPVRAMAAHPGYAGTHLVANGRFGRSSGGIASVLDRANQAIGQSPAIGAWPTLMAATADLQGSTYCGPSGLGEAGGPPQLVGWSRQAGDRESQRRLWEVSEEATGISYP